MTARITREQRTVAVMIGMYCSTMHGLENNLCESCLQMKNYAEKRTEKCRFGKDKPICANCPVHCYKPEMRQKIREVMRHSGPRMINTHPYLALMHVIDKNRFKNYKIK